MWLTRYIFLPPFSLHSSWTLNWLVHWSANHEGPSRTAVMEINTTASRLSGFQLHPFLVPERNNDTVWGNRLSISTIFTNSRSLANFIICNLPTHRIENIQKRTHKYSIIDSINYHFNYDSSDSRYTIPSRTTQNNRGKDLRSISRSTPKTKGSFHEDHAKGSLSTFQLHVSCTFHR